MKLKELLKQITSLPWRFAEMDNDKVNPSIRMFGRRKSDPSKEVCFGRIDSVRDARYACHAANVLPQLLDAATVLQKLVPYGPHLSPETNRALASLRAAIDSAEKLSMREV